MASKVRVELATSRKDRRQKGNRFSRRHFPYCREAIQV